MHKPVDVVSGSEGELYVSSDGTSEASSGTVLVIRWMGAMAADGGSGGSSGARAVVGVVELSALVLLVSLLFLALVIWVSVSHLVLRPRYTIISHLKQCEISVPQRTDEERGLQAARLTAGWESGCGVECGS